MRRLVLIGVGGSGAACVEAAVHMAALGLFPPDCEVVPLVVDPDSGHSRTIGFQGFLDDYRKLREAGNATNLSAPGFLGCRITPVVAAGPLKPAAKRNLFQLLGLTSSQARSLAPLFFASDELGRPDSTEFELGFYGRANAGVCFFADPEGEEQFLVRLRQYFTGGNSTAVIFGSAFGGTGAAGAVHVATVLAKDPQIRTGNPSVALAQLEPYFYPDPSGASMAGMTNMPETYERRTETAYRFLHQLGSAALPFQALYLLGASEPVVLPPGPEWFKKDQQDNPSHFVEYLAALAASDFVHNPGSRAETVVRYRREPSGDFKEPLLAMRRLLQSATASLVFLDRVVLPILTQRGGSDAVPGHPWVHDVLRASGLTGQALLQHLSAARNLLARVLEHAGLAPRSSARGQAFDTTWTERTQKSFPSGFATPASLLDLRNELTHADPSSVFESYAREGEDALLPSRALFRWAGEAVRKLPPGSTGQHPGRLQLVKQTDSPRTDNKPLGLPVPSDDAFLSVPARDTLHALTKAAWKSDPAAGERKPSEYPTIWAPALTFAERLWGSRPGTPVRDQYLGLVWLALMKLDGRTSPPLHLFRLDASLSGAFRNALVDTFPLGSLGNLVCEEGVLVLHSGRMVARESPPAAEDLAGFLFPETIVVPAASLDGEKEKWLAEVGRAATQRSFPAWLTKRLGEWPAELKKALVPTWDVAGPHLLRILGEFPAGQGRPVTDQEAYSSLPLTSIPVTSVSSWIRFLYRS